MKSNIFLTIIKIIIGLFVLIGGIYLIYANFIKNEEKDNQNGDAVEKIITKLENDKDWVYEADYNLPTEKESYYAYGDHSKLVSAKDIIVPYINIDTTDAKKANEEIYKLYEHLIAAFNENVKEEIWYTTVEYKVYTNDDVVSIIITTESGGTAVPGYSYYTYNFNLKNGSLLTYEDAYKYTGLKKKDIEDKVKQAITTFMKKEFSYDMDMEPYINASINNYKTDVSDEKISYFIDDDKKLNIIVVLSVPVETGELDKIIVVE